MKQVAKPEGLADLVHKKQTLVSLYLIKVLILGVGASNALPLCVRRSTFRILTSLTHLNFFSFMECPLEHLFPLRLSVALRGVALTIARHATQRAAVMEIGL